jgi:hypothetical protein
VNERDDKAAADVSRSAASKWRRILLGEQESQQKAEIAQCTMPGTNATTAASWGQHLT